MTEVRIEVLKASYGDCIFITIKDDDSQVFTIMMDGGLQSAYQVRDKKGRLVDGCLKQKLDQMRNGGLSIDLLIITHVDKDHIGGILSWFKHDFPTADFVKEIWINDDVEVAEANNLDNSTAQAASLIEILKERNIKYVNQLVVGRQFCFDWGRIYVLAPKDAHHNAIAKEIGKELNNNADEDYQKSIKAYLLELEKWVMDDVTAENDASIAILLQANDGDNYLFLGDANIRTVMDCISKSSEIGKPMKCRMVKLSHHGSRNNFMPEFLDLVKSDGYIFSTDGSLYHHPHKEVLAQLIGKTTATLYFNYIERGKSMITEQDKTDYPGIMDRIKEI